MAIGGSIAPGVSYSPIWDIMSIYGPKSPATPAVAGGTTAAGTLTGATPTGYTAASGGVPQVPSPQTTQAQAITGNIANLPKLTGLASDVNAFNLGEVTKQYLAGIPQYNAMTTESSGNILAALRGEVPSDVTNLLQQSAAERGIATGGAGSPNANAAYLRALGLTSLGQQQYGEQALTGAVARMPRTALYNVAGGMVTPEEQQQAAYMANVLAAAPIPQAAYNQALAASIAGQNRGYNATRSPIGLAGVPGGSYGGSAAVDIANKYNPVATVTDPTQPGYKFKYGEYNPNYETTASPVAGAGMSDEDWYLANMGSPPYSGGNDLFDYEVNYGPYGLGSPPYVPPADDEEDWY